jgi:transposase
MRGLIAARAAVLDAVRAIDADMRKIVRKSDSCGRLMTIPGVGQLTALAFTAAVDDLNRFRRSRDIGAYFGLVPRRYQSGEVDYTGGISKCGDRRVAKGADRTRSPTRNHHACDAARRRGIQSRLVDRLSPVTRPNRAPERERRPREGVDDGADYVACGCRQTAISTEPPRTQLTPLSAT